MNIFYIFTILFILLSVQRNINNLKYIIYYNILLVLYTYFYFFYNHSFKIERGSLYETFLYDFGPFFITIVISLYIKFEMQRNKKTINELDEKMDFLNTKIKTAIVTNNKIKKERRDIEKRLISGEKESIKIREIFEETSDFNLEKNEENLLNYFQRLLPNAKMRLYKNESNIIKYKLNNYEEMIISEKIDDNLLEIIKNNPNNIITQVEYPQIKEKLIIKVHAERELFAIIIVDYLDFKYLNRATIQSLHYFTKLLSLQIQNTIIYQRQKELSYSYNSKNIYNLYFLKKMINLRVNLSKREGITSYLILIKSEEFIVKEEEEEIKLFDDIENLYTKYFREEDFVFYNQHLNCFIFLLITDSSKVDKVLDKIRTKLDTYSFSLEEIAITKTSKKTDILEQVGITVNNEGKVGIING
ncbi:MAG: hypothetical protein CL623_11130 [Arcobacter sp.]|nr:hypothetical protein [Arcobacter sp.]